MGLNGVGSAQLNITNHKNQFNMNNQPGLFPKITNIRIENQSIPNSAHSGGHNGSAAMQSAGTMNVLKSSGGHISGMSNHPNLAASNER